MPDKEILLVANNIVKTYNKTIAVNDCSFEIKKGEVLSIVGGNGAGKSTLTRMISGVTAPDSGNMTFNGTGVDFSHFDAHRAIQNGIRVVYQEISLCTNLKVYENFYVELRDLMPSKRSWRRTAKKLASASIEAVFPGSSIDVDLECSRLTIAQQQMVEIARAFADPNLKMIILDEPTSSLASVQTAQLLDYIKKRTAKGVSVVYISHRLKEVLQIADSILIMSNGKGIWYGANASVTESFLTQMMSLTVGNVNVTQEVIKDEVSKINRYVVKETNPNIGVELSCVNSFGLHNLAFRANGGEIIGITGLEGNGQKSLLDAIFSFRDKKDSNIRVQGKVAFVTGDRKKEGNFPLWDILQNIVITKLSFGKLFSVSATEGISDTANYWYNKLKIKSYGMSANITELSGGNQQKVLIARAMAADVDIIILDDPTRGVDVATKRDIYLLLTELADAGKLVIFYSSESLEMELCNRVEVMRYGTVVKELTGENISSDSVVEASFLGENLKSDVKQEKAASSGHKISLALRNPAVVPFIAMLIVYALCGWKAPKVFSFYGIELLLKGAAPLIVLAIGQMFIVGLGHVDLGAGYYMGFVNVICATILYTRPALGWGVLIGGIILYACLGLIVYYRNVPAVVVTLGMSFVWSGIALTIQEQPGGRVPTWLSNLFWLKTGIPMFILFIIVIAIAAVVFHRSKYGTVLKGFGNNPVALVKSGWSQPKAYFSIYLTSAVFMTLAGFIMSGLTAASDSTVSGTYTMQTVAAVIVGGGHLLGGRVSVEGTVFGAITFSLISSLLGFMKVSSELTAAVQGLILIGILALRIMKKGKG